jgi:hypothetical protein
MNVPVASPAALPFVIVCLSLIGCSPASPSAAPPTPSKHDDHDHDHDHAHADDHAHPKTLAAGVTGLQKLFARLKAALAAEKVDADDADESVHGIAHLLEDLRGIAAKATLGDQAKAAATKALDELEDCFGKVDEAFHAGDDKAEPPAKVLASVAERIEAAIKALEEVK